MCVCKIITIIISTITRQQYQWQGSPHSSTKSGQKHPHVSSSFNQAGALVYIQRQRCLVFAIGIVIAGDTIVFSIRLWLAHLLHSPQGDYILLVVCLLHSRQ